MGNNCCSERIYHCSQSKRKIFLSVALQKVTLMQLNMFKGLDLSSPVLYGSPKIIKSNQNILFHQNQIQNLKSFILTYPHIKLNGNWHVPLGKKNKFDEASSSDVKLFHQSVLTGSYFHQINHKTMTTCNAYKNLADSL